MYSCRTVPPDAQMCGLRTAVKGRPISFLGPDVLRNMLPLLTSPAFLLAVSCAAGFGPLSIPLIWTKVAAERRLRMPCAVRSLLEPTSTLSATLLPRSPCLGWLRLSLFLLSLGTPPFLGIAVCTLKLAGSLVLGLGSPLTRRASIPTFILHFSAWLSSAVFAYRYGIATRLAACAGKFSTAGEITPLPVAVGWIGFCAITRSGMWSDPRSLSSRRSRLSLRSLASFSLQGPPILVVLTSTPTPLLLLPLLLVAALPMSGLPGACPASLKPGTSRFRRCFSLLLLPRLPMSSWNP